MSSQEALLEPGATALLPGKQMGKLLVLQLRARAAGNADWAAKEFVIETSFLSTPPCPCTPLSTHFWQCHSFC